MTEATRQSPTPADSVPLGGVTEILSGHKGYGLAMLVELLTGGLSGGAEQIYPACARGHLLLLHGDRPGALRRRAGVREHVKYIINEYRKRRPLIQTCPSSCPATNRAAAPKR
ncbi:MAG: hypothetical protein ACLUEQ_02345 [Cloacibacillus evryensis]